MRQFARSQSPSKVALSLLILTLAVTSVFAFQAQRVPSRFDALSLPDPSARSATTGRAIETFDAADPLRLGWEQFRIANGGGWRVHIDSRSGAPLLVEGQGIPWIAGRGNSLKDAGPVTLDSLERSLRSFLSSKRGLLLADDSELVLARDASGLIAPEVWQVVFQRQVSGVPVAGDRYIFTIGHGNLVSFGATRWGRITASPAPTLDAAGALARLTGYMGLRTEDAYEIVDPGHIEMLPSPRGNPENEWTGAAGDGWGTALAYRQALRVAGEPGTWVGLVDAHTGAVLALYDDNHYALAKGGVYPVSDDQICPDGCEQPGWPMPYADITINASGQTASTMGLFNCSPGGALATTTLAGPYVRVFDNCGPVSESISCDADLDLKQSTGADCVVPSGSSAGNTHASRTGFYHLNKIAEHGRSWLPSNVWLTQQLVDNVNINSTCNAYWNGSVNFYKSGGGCNNTGEIAGVFLHEWGHGIDQNDGGGYDNPSEAYADITAFMVTHVSCIGRGFFQSGNCGGYGDACLNCSGIRDDDWDTHASHQPHTPANFLQPNCGGGSGPCGKEVHCEGYVSAEALWDLAKRDLPPTGMDQETAWALTDKLWYKSRNGSGGNAYNCSLPNSDGCNAGSWFTKLRTIDDDNGNLNDGTPHAAAIFAAFNRHVIACGGVNDASNTNSSSCPSIAAPTISGQAGSSSAVLSWSSVANSSTYHVMRNDQGCGTAFTIVADVPAPGTSYTDQNLADGFTNYYRVQAAGTNGACESAVSNCIAVTPQPFAGTVSFERATYGCSTLLTVKVKDGNIGTPTTTITIASNSEPTPETVTLTQQSPGSATYTGSIQATSAPAAPNGLLSISHNDVITAKYIDADDGLGGHNLLRQGTAIADCVGPAISAVGSSGVTDHVAAVNWLTDQAADSVLNWGPTPPPANTSSNAASVGTHSIALSGLQQCTVYYYQVKSTDPAGNLSTDNNGGQYYHFETLGNFGQGLQPCHQGRVSLNQSAYACSDSVRVQVIDIDLNTNPGVAETLLVQMTSTTETQPESLLLTETGPATSTFVGFQATNAGTVAHDGILQVRGGDAITATYHDANDGTGATHVAYSSSSADCAGPAISGIIMTDLPPGRVQVTWSTPEPATSRVDWGPTTGLGNAVTDGALVTSHSLFVSPLSFCGNYYFKVTSTDTHGNTAVADRGGLLYSFQSGDVPGRVYYDNFETAGGWTLTGDWQRGTPQGLGNPGGRDPSGAWAGSGVIGNDLTGVGANPGDYEPNTTSTATSAVINCTNLHNGQLIIRRWLNLQASPADSAKVVIQKGTAVTPVWQSPTFSTLDSSWSREVYSISAIADTKPNVQLAFSLSADASLQYGGWNVDDVLIKDGSLPDAKFCGTCAQKPSFAGATLAVDNTACGDTGITISWPAAAAWGSSGSGTYAVYRSTTPNFTPSVANRISMGLGTLTYNDATAPNGATLYYVVRAENNETCSTGPNNGGKEDDNLAYVSATDSLSQPTPADVGATFRAAEIADTTVRLTWTASAGAANFRVYRADNPRMIAALLLGTTPGILLEDTGEATGQTSRYYVVRGVNSCNVEGP